MKPVIRASRTVDWLPFRVSVWGHVWGYVWNRVWNRVWLPAKETTR